MSLFRCFLCRKLKLAKHDLIEYVVQGEIKQQKICQDCAETIIEVGYEDDRIEVKPDRHLDDSE